jgi:ferredoxin
VSAAFEPVRRDGPIQIVCATAGVTLVVPADTSILEAVRGAGLEVTGACAHGRCGSCETRVLEGQPDHRDGVLSAEERSIGDTMMICVSRARTGRLVLDL